MISINLLSFDNQHGISKRSLLLLGLHKFYVYAPVILQKTLCDAKSLPQPMMTFYDEWAIQKFSFKHEF